jgi:hypothetical protein
LLNDRTLRDRLSRQERTWVTAAHSWNKTTAVYQNIYAAAAGEGRSLVRTA